MNLKAQIDSDLKQALLRGDKELVTILRGLKSAILYVEVAENSRDQGLGDEGIIAVLQKEAKKRQESADMYAQANETERAKRELHEKAIIQQYLPEEMSEEDIKKLVDEAVAIHGHIDQSTMGKIIGEVKQKSAGRADGGTIARLVKGRLG